MGLCGLDDLVRFLAIIFVIVCFILGSFSEYVDSQADTICKSFGYETYVTYDQGGFLGSKLKNLTCGDYSDRLVAEGIVKPKVINNETIYVGDGYIIKKTDEMR